MNKILNEAWLKDGWKVSLDDHDVSSEDVLDLFGAAGQPDTFGVQWQQWSEHTIRNIRELHFT